MTQATLPTWYLKTIVQDLITEDIKCDDNYNNQLQ